MDRRTFLKTVPALTVLAGTASTFAEDLKPITLLGPQTDGGKSVLAALKERRTAASAGNSQEIDLYVALPEGDVQKSYYYVATGLIAQNVYLFAASQGLAAHFHNCDKQNTPEEFKLRPEQRVLFSQTVGYPA